MRQKLISIGWCVSFFLLYWSVQVGIFMLLSLFKTLYRMSQNRTYEIKKALYYFNWALAEAQRNTALYLIGSAFLTVLFSIYIVRKRKKNLASELPHALLPVSSALVCMLMGFFVILISVPILDLTARVFPQQVQRYQENFQSIHQNAPGLLFLAIGVAGPLAEEVVLRGLMLSELRRNFSIGAAVLLQAVLFALLHGNIAQGSYALIIGLIFGVLQILTGSLWGPFLAHMVNNSIAVGSALLSRDLPTRPPTEALPAPALLGMLLTGLALSFLCLRFLYKRRPAKMSSAYRAA